MPRQDEGDLLEAVLFVPDECVADALITCQVSSHGRKTDDLFILAPKRRRDNKMIFREGEAVRNSCSTLCFSFSNGQDIEDMGFYWC